MIRKIFFLISVLSLSFASGGNATWMDSWILPDPGIFLWTLVTFLIVLAILKWKAWGPLMKALDDREKQIHDALNAAESAKEEAAKVVSDNEEVLNKARQDAQEIVAQAREAGDQLKTKLEKEGQAKYESLLEKAKEQINAEKQTALGEIKDMVVDVAIKASEKVIKRNLNNDDNKKMIEKTVDEFKQTN